MSMFNFKNWKLLLGGLLVSSTLCAQEHKVKMISNKPIGSKIILTVNKCHSGLTVDWGDGTPVSYKLDDRESIVNLEGTVKGKEIMVSGKQDWYMLDCSNNELTDINLSEGRYIRSLYCNDNLLTSLDVRGLNMLVDLNCANNNISKFVYTDSATPNKDLGAITNLNISNNKFEGRYLQSLPTLQYMNASNNSFSSFYIYDKDLRTLDISGNTVKNTMSFKMSPYFSTLNCSDNQIVAVIFYNNGERMTQVHCDSNKIRSIDVSNATRLQVLSCKENQLSSLTYNEKAPIEMLNVAENRLNFSALPLYDNQPDYFFFEPQAPFDIAHVEGMLDNDGECYAPICTRWNDRTKTVINISDFCKLSNNRYDAKYKVFSVEPDGSEKELVKGTSSEQPSDFYCSFGKFAFFTPHKQAYIELTSKTFGFAIKSSPFAIGETMTALEKINQDGPSLRISIKAGQICLYTQQPQEVSIYTISGKKVWHKIVSSEASINLPSGVYVVNDKKVIL